MKEKKFFILGIICLIFALFTITILPCILKKQGLFYPDNYYIWLEFMFLVLTSIFYHISPKYYDIQMFSILTAMLYYIFFAKVAL